MRKPDFEGEQNASYAVRNERTVAGGVFTVGDCA